jgi:TRAP-type C4-dicarboxylate transport system substrate-binding protein
MKRFLFCLVGLLFVMVFVLGVQTAQAEKKPLILKAVSFLPKHDINMSGWWPLIEDINKKAKGDLTIKFVGGPEAVPGFKQFDAVKNGVVDVIYGCESYYGRLVSGAAFTHLTRVTPWVERTNGYFEFRSKLLEKFNIHYLGRPENNVWFHVFTNKKVKRPQDLEGQKIRVSATYEAFAKKLGAAPVTLPGKDIYTALERGTIDGYAWSVMGNTVKNGQGWTEVCKYILKPRIYQMNIEALVNLDTWKKIPKQLQQVMTNCMIENEMKYSGVLNKLAEDEYFQMQKEGMEVIAFSSEDTKWYIDLAYEAAWEDVIKQSPEVGKKARHLLTP